MVPLRTPAECHLLTEARPAQVAVYPETDHLVVLIDHQVLTVFLLWIEGLLLDHQSVLEDHMEGSLREIVDHHRLEKVVLQCGLLREIYLLMHVRHQVQVSTDTIYCMFNQNL